MRDFQQEVILPPGGPWQCLEAFLIVTTGGGEATALYRLEARTAVKYPTTHGTAPHNKELSGPKWR